eukprot:160433_1
MNITLEQKANILKEVQIMKQFKIIFTDEETEDALLDGKPSHYKSKKWTMFNDTLCRIGTPIQYPSKLTELNGTFNGNYYKPNKTMCISFIIERNKYKYVIYKNGFDKMASNDAKSYCNPDDADELIIINHSEKGINKFEMIILVMGTVNWNDIAQNWTNAIDIFKRTYNLLIVIYNQCKVLRPELF